MSEESTVILIHEVLKGLKVLARTRSESINNYLTTKCKTATEINLRLDYQPLVEKGAHATRKRGGN